MIIGIILVLGKKLFQFAEALRWKWKFKYQTKDFQKFIDEQNKNVFKSMEIEIQVDREGCWLEFLLTEDEDMFEEKIAKRREKIFKEKNQAAIEEMKKILQEYSQEKESQNQDA